MGMNVEHIVLFVLAAFLLYHLTSSCGCANSVDGFNVGAQTLGRGRRPGPHLKVKKCSNIAVNCNNDCSWSAPDGDFPNPEVYGNCLKDCYDEKKKTCNRGCYRHIGSRRFKCFSDCKKDCTYVPPPIPPPPPPLPPLPPLEELCKVSRDPETCANNKCKWCNAPLIEKCITPDATCECPKCSECPDCIDPSTCKAPCKDKSDCGDLCCWKGKFAREGECGPCKNY